MTRKRFVKLVMSCGYDRNYANTYAAAAVMEYGSYQSVWKASYKLRFIHGEKYIANSIIPSINCTVKNFNEGIANATLALRKLSADLRLSNKIVERDDYVAQSYAGGSPEMVAADLPGDEEHGAPAEQTEHSGAVSG